VELVGIENSRIILLTQMHRPSGQLYLPDAATQLIERYSFVKGPTIDQPMPYVFSIGKFRDAQIAEFSIYNDGLIASSASDTDLLDAFIQDLLSWVGKTFGFVQMATAKPEKYYESSVIVRSTCDLAAALQPQNDVAAALKPAMESAQIKASFTMSGFILDCDPAEIPGRRKPFRFVIDRRLGVPFIENVFFSQAPFRTKDHVGTLQSLEDIVSPPQGKTRRH
jgi:hypothetical protein